MNCIHCCIFMMTKAASKCNVNVYVHQVAVKLTPTHSFTFVAGPSSPFTCYLLEEGFDRLVTSLVNIKTLQHNVNGLLGSSKYLILLISTCLCILQLWN